MDERAIRVAVPLDGQGFLRRECPTCEREFKWLVAQEGDEGAPVPEGGYYCPYCCVQAPPEAWLTKGQATVVGIVSRNELAGPAFRELAKSLNKLGRSSGGFVRLEANISEPVPEPVPTLMEPDDMLRVDFPCHPDEPIKVLEDWEGTVACLVCGVAVSR